MKLNIALVATAMALTSVQAAPMSISLNQTYNSDNQVMTVNSGPSTVAYDQPIIDQNHRVEEQKAKERYEHKTDVDHNNGHTSPDKLKVTVSSGGNGKDYWYIEETATPAKVDPKKPSPYTSHSSFVIKGGPGKYATQYSTHFIAKGGLGKFSSETHESMNSKDISMVEGKVPDGFVRVKLSDLNSFSKLDPDMWRGLGPQVSLTSLSTPAAKSAELSKLQIAARSLEDGEAATVLLDGAQLV